MKSGRQLGITIWVGLGMVLLYAGRMLAEDRQWTGALTPGAAQAFCVVAGLAALVWGCMSYAEAKGYNRWLGLLGGLACVGLLILALLPDRSGKT